MDNDTKEKLIDFIDACRKSKSCKITKTRSGIIVVLDDNCIYVGTNGQAEFKKRDFGWRYVATNKRGHR